MQEMVTMSMSISARFAAWLAWIAVAVLLAAYVLTGDMRPAIVGLATSAAAATLHIRCFCIKIDRHMKTAFELGRESAGSIHLVPYSTTPSRRD